MGRLGNLRRSQLGPDRHIIPSKLLPVSFPMDVVGVLCGIRTHPYKHYRLLDMNTIMANTHDLSEMGILDCLVYINPLAFGIR